MVLTSPILKMKEQFRTKNENNEIANRKLILEQIRSL